jgi:hypothetical protein
VGMWAYALGGGCLFVCGCVVGVVGKKWLVGFGISGGVYHSIHTDCGFCAASITPYSTRLPTSLPPRFDRKAEATQPLVLPDGTTPQAALEAVLRLPGVGSKRFLTTKVGAAPLPGKRSQE